MDIRGENLEPDCFYHIYNRGINGTAIFKNEENYSFFLKQFSKYVLAISDVYAYCLMPNHFHFILKIKSKQELNDYLSEQNKGKVIHEGLHANQNVSSKQISKFISSYTQAFNKVNDRHGALLESPFKRIKVDTEDYLRNLIIYIHQNPLGMNVDFRCYKFSSYQSVLSKSKTNVMRNQVIELFFDLENFVFCHEKIIDFEESI